MRIEYSLNLESIAKSRAVEVEESLLALQQWLTQAIQDAHILDWCQWEVAIDGNLVGRRSVWHIATLAKEHRMARDHSQTEIQDALKASSVAMEEIAHKVGVSRAEIYKLRAGEHYPTQSTWQSLASVLDLDEKRFVHSISSIQKKLTKIGSDAYRYHDEWVVTP